MKLRALRQWPALFVAFLAFVAGPAAYGVDQRLVSLTTAGVADGAVHDPVVADAIDEVATLCEAATLRSNRGVPGARDCRVLAERIDAAVARALQRRPNPSPSAQRALADLLGVAEAMRSPDNRIRKFALSGVRRSGLVPRSASVEDGGAASIV